MRAVSCELLARGGQRVDDVVPLEVDLLPHLLRRARLVDVDLAQAEVACPVHGHAFDELAPGRGGDVDARDAELLEGDGDDARGGRGAHIAEGQYRGDRLLLGEHGRIVLEDLGAFAAHGLLVVDEVSDAHLAEALLDPDEGLAIVAEIEFRVVVEEDLSLLQLLPTWVWERA